MNEQKINELFEQSISLLQKGRPHDAMKGLAKLDQVIPSNPGILFFTATGYSILGKKHKAIQVYERVLRLNPQFIEAYNNLGLDLAYLGEHQQAIVFFDKALAIRPDFLECRINKGISLSKLALTSEAKDCFEEVLRQNPEHIDALVNISVVYIMLGKHDTAREFASKALSINPNDSRAYQNLGDISLKEERAQDALDFFKQAHSLNPTNVDIISGLGSAHLALEHYEEAMSQFEKALAINPDHGQTHGNLAILHHELRQFNKAIEIFNNPISDRSRVSNREYNRSLSYLHAGLLYEGWRDYNWRWKESTAPIPYIQTARPLWEGQKTDEPILIWHEQGIGDQILFGTLLAEAATQAQNLVVRLDNRLVPLFQRSLPSIRFIPDDYLITDSDFKYHSPIGDLARLFRNKPNDFEHQPAFYLNADSIRADTLSHNLSNGSPIIGLAWVTKGQRSKERNLPIDEVISTIQNTLRSTLVDLQYSDTTEDRARIVQNQEITIQRLSEVDNLLDLDGLAALISACNLVITCSNSTAHLAGALGKETYLLIPFSRGRHWYWSHIGNDGRSLWYPSIRVIPQIIAGDWTEPLRALQEHLSSRPKLN